MRGELGTESEKGSAWAWYCAYVGTGEVAGTPSPRMEGRCPLTDCWQRVNALRTVVIVYSKIF